MTDAGAPVPFFFGPTDRKVFGWLHPLASMRTDTGVVLCAPHGREEAGSYRTLATLAKALAAAGMPVLRFDYHGCGNSGGDEGGADMPAAWIGSVHAAIDALRATSRCSRVVLVGLRLGVLLAASAAAERDDVSALVAIAGVTQGRRYVREQRALQAARGRSDAVAGPPDPADGSLEAGGYLMTAATADALAAIDLATSPRAPCRHVLVLDRDDLPAPSGWVEHLAASGCSVERETFAGYVEMMQDPHHAMVPPRLVEAVVRWLAASAGERRDAAMPAGPIAEMPVAIGEAVEQPVQVEADGTRLFGMLTLPGSDRPPGAAIVLLNAGAQRNVGPGRLYVTLARALAAAGSAVLRIDQSGLGDSPPRPGVEENIVYSETAVAEVGAAVRYLQRRWPRLECRLIGLCSGGYHAFRATLQGAPVHGVAVVNPLTFRWRHDTPLDAPLPAHVVASEMARYRADLFEPERWRKLLRGEVDLMHLAELLRRRGAAVLARRTRDLARLLGVPLRDDLAADLAHCARERIALRFVFSEGDPGEDLLRAGAGRAVDRLLREGAIDIERIAGTDHTFTDRRGRAHLVALLTRFAAAAVAPACAAPAASAAPGVQTPRRTAKST